ncbi:MAG: PDR/VanB family oxidoreductase [Nevskia sp.]|uniref:PDR/VanB family oxidoreductase n=1 Tax=Nevskia sp. TaxID=1929292 RepID=UPI00403568A0
MNPQTLLTLRIDAIRCEARDALLIELRDPAGDPLPPFTAGAHVELEIEPRLRRSYSLCNDPLERDRYCLGVGLARDSRGGSRRIHDSYRVGQLVRVSQPRNHFPLSAADGERLFIAGGIGITPIMAMIHQSQREGRPWKLHYCVRNRVRAAFYETLQALAPGRVHFHFDDEQQGRLFDADAALSQAPANAGIYTCGPEPLMKAVEAAGSRSGRAADDLHFEWFSAAAVDSAADKAFRVLLARTGIELQVPADRSLLDVLEENGCGVPYACREGTCGTCRTEVLAGDCEHRDTVLSAAEKADNRAIMVCVSRARSERIEIDL